MYVKHDSLISSKGWSWWSRKESIEWPFGELRQKWLLLVVGSREYIVRVWLAFIVGSHEGTLHRQPKGNSNRAWHRKWDSLQQLIITDNVVATCICNSIARTASYKKNATRNCAFVDLWCKPKKCIPFAMYAKCVFRPGGSMFFRHPLVCSIMLVRVATETYQIARGDLYKIV